MSTPQMIGAALLVSPLLALFVAMVRIEGWRVALAIWGIVLAAVTVVTTGAMLLSGDLP